MQGHGLSPLPKETNDAQLFAQTRMLRVKQINGLNFATALPTSSRRFPILPPGLFFMKFRGPQVLGNR